MKKMLFVILTLTIFNCSSDDDSSSTTSIDANLIGRWNLVGFEGAVLYQFTEEKRYTMYSSDGEFETLEDHITSGQQGNNWFYENNKVTIDLNFGNSSTLTPQFVCGNYVINWLQDDGQLHSTIYREDYDYATCDE